MMLGTGAGGLYPYYLWRRQFSWMLLDQSIKDIMITDKKGRGFYAEYLLPSVYKGTYGRKD